MNISKNTKKKMRKIYLAKNSSSKVLLDEVLRLNGIFDYELEYNGCGKPYLVGNPVFFNLSHSGEYTACAISDKEIGIDIQKICFKKRAMQKVCTPEELAQIKTAEDFTRIWAIKESYAKAKGIGIGMGLKNIDSLSLRDVEVWGWDGYVVACYNEG